MEETIYIFWFLTKNKMHYKGAHTERKTNKQKTVKKHNPPPHIVKGQSTQNLAKQIGINLERPHEKPNLKQKSSFNPSE